MFHFPSHRIGGHLDYTSCISENICPFERQKWEPAYHSYLRERDPNRHAVYWVEENSGSSKSLEALWSWSGLKTWNQLFTFAIMMIENVHTDLRAPGNQVCGWRSGSCWQWSGGAKHTAALHCGTENPFKQKTCGQTTRILVRTLFSRFLWISVTDGGLGRLQVNSKSKPDFLCTQHLHFGG